jgi:hypothetical protein
MEAKLLGVEGYKLQNWITRLLAILSIIAILGIASSQTPVPVVTLQPYNITSYTFSEESLVREIGAFSDVNGSIDTSFEKDINVLGPGRYHLALPRWSSDRVVPINESVYTIAIGWTHHLNIGGLIRNSTIRLEWNATHDVNDGSNYRTHTFDPGFYEIGMGIAFSQTAEYELIMNFTSKENPFANASEIVSLCTFQWENTCSGYYVVNYMVEYFVNLVYYTTVNHTIDQPVLEFQAPVLSIGFIALGLGAVIILWMIFEIFTRRRTQRMINSSSNQS